MPTLRPSEIQTKLTMEQKEAVGLLSIGTFLEYFDLLLYVHMAVMLNDLFFPKTDPHTTQLVAAFAFCSTFVFRPIGALLFGYIGDNFGRKMTVVITTMIMSISCAVIANAKTYAEIGITASFIITACRIMQGMSSMGEIIGASVYFTETLGRPMQYVATAWLAFLAGLGGTVALGVASLMTHIGFDWRAVFWIGACVAIIGAVARTALRETPAFLDAKLALKEIVNNPNVDSSVKDSYLKGQKVNIKTVVAAFFIECPWPICFYVAFVSCGEVLRTKFGFTPEQIIEQNFIVSIGEILGFIPLLYLARRVYPLTILKYKLVIFSIFLLLFPYLLSIAGSPREILFIQFFIMFVAIDTTPAKSIFIVHFPVLRRFTCAGLAYALSRTVMYSVIAFGSLFLVERLGYSGLLLIIVPVFTGYALALRHFTDLEITSGKHSQVNHSN